MDAFNIAVTAIFGLAVLHTLAASRFHRLGEVEIVFGLWVVPLMATFVWFRGWSEAVHYLTEGVTYSEALLVVVLMALASTRPIVVFAETVVGRIASIGGGTPAAWWVTILTITPLLGSVITEPAAMTIAALLLTRQFFGLAPSLALRYATLGLLFVNVSIGGTLTHFAAPPVLVVARPWGWDTWFMASTFGWKAALAIVLSTIAYFALFRKELVALAARSPKPDHQQPHEDSRATSRSQNKIDLRTPLLVGVFLAGLVIHGGLQGWWIAPLLSGLSETRLFLGATLLTAFNDNALITYLATLVPSMDEPLRIAVVEGAVTGGGLTVIANAPNPAGQALLSRFFEGAINPLWLFAAALLPTVITAAAFRLL